MSFPENTGPNSVQFLKGGGVDLLDDDVEEKAKVLEVREPSVDEVGSSDGKEVIYISFEGVEQFCCLDRGDRWDSRSTPCNFNVFAVQESILEGVGGLHRGHVRSLEGG